MDSIKWAARALGAFGITAPPGLVAMDAVNSRSVSDITGSFGTAVWIVFWVVYGIAVVAVAGMVVLLRRERRVVPLGSWRRPPADARKPAPVPVRPAEPVRVPLAIEAPKRTVPAATEMLDAIEGRVIPARRGN